MYEINVSLNGHHLFATHERSLFNENEFIRALKIFVEKFPESEGYSISASRQNNSSTPLEIKKYL